MDEKRRAVILEINKRLIDMVIQRAKRDFPNDISLIGLTGSFSTGDYHERSDLDLIIVNETERGWEIADCFILGMCATTSNARLGSRESRMLPC